MMTFRAGFTVKVERNQQEWDVIIKRIDPVGGALCIAGFNDEDEAKRLALHGELHARDAKEKAETFESAANIARAWAERPSARGES